MCDWLGHEVKLIVTSNTDDSTGFDKLFTIASIDRLTDFDILTHRLPLIRGMNQMKSCLI